MISRRKTALVVLIASLIVGIYLTASKSVESKAFTDDMDKKEEQQNEEQAKILFDGGVEKAVLAIQSDNSELYKEALRDVEKSLELDPKNAATHFYAANLKAQLGDLSGMIAGYDKAIEIAREQGNMELVEALEDEKRRFIKDFDTLKIF